MSTLYLSDNSKTKFCRNHRNTIGFMYGLPENGGTCPGATTGKGGCLDVRDGLKRPTCYMAKITQIYKAVGVRLAQNTELMNAADYEGKVRLLDEAISSFKENNEREQWFFRINYSGDLPNEEWAKAWVEVINKHPEVRFWGYTRSHQYAHLFAGLPNISLYLSCDPVNRDAVLETFKKLEHHDNIALAWLGTENLPEGYKFVNCPETSGRLKSEKDEGACAKCRLCVDNFKIRLKHINFTYH